MTCLESAMPDTGSAAPDAEIPAPGKAFFYLVEFDDGQSSTYGSVSAPKPRVPGAGVCP